MDFDILYVKGKTSPLQYLEKGNVLMCSVSKRLDSLASDQIT